MKRQVIAGNWKMNKDLDSALDFIKNVKLDELDNEVMIFAPSIFLSELHKNNKTSVQIGAQNIHQEDSGAFTGEVSVEQIKSVGINLTLIGHSERRQFFNESDKVVNAKLKKALENDIRAIVCVGEQKIERESNLTNQVLESQIKEAFKDISKEDFSKIIVAYEPVWAIGTGLSASDQDANDACKYIRNLVKDLYDQEVAQELVIQYGGSVKPDTITNLLKQSDIDGALIGGASLEVDSFNELINTAGFDKEDNSHDGPVLLAIMDGVGIRSEEHGNAVMQANTPYLDKLVEDYPHSKLYADGLNVGLPDGQIGNSEVGHLNIGAGRVVNQVLVKVNKEIESNIFKDHVEIIESIQNCKANNKALHLMGLVSDGGVHSHINHLFALLDIAKNNGLEEVYVHAFLDGRDVDPKSGIHFIKQLSDKLDSLSLPPIASISGRYYAMDRDKRFERVELAYNAVVNAVSEYSFDNAFDYVEQSYSKEEYDEFVKPAVDSNLNKKIEDNESVIFFNFRPDRAIQLSAVLTNDKYDAPGVFKPINRPNNLNFVSLVKYSDDVLSNIIIKKEEIVNTLGDVISNNGLKQLRIAETEKYAHVTFFFDGGVDKEIEGSKRILINSPKVATYDLQPEMSAFELTDTLLKELDTNHYDLIVLNFANPDMVGHTGKLEETKIALQTVDTCLSKVVSKVQEQNGSAIIVADHGNSEIEVNDDGSPHTAHTTNPVPLIVVNKDIEIKQGKYALGDIAPSILTLLNIEQPNEMTGSSFILKK
ncbi:MAG: 2,3-bisphosphoglycerate-independent phosphoglycerate mutase [Mycoplasmatales bacterium]